MRSDPDRILTAERARARFLPRKPVFPYAPVAPSNDTIEIGADPSGRPFLLDGSSWQRHVVLQGASGLGKSREGAALLMQPIQRMARGGKPTRIAISDIKNESSELIGMRCVLEMRRATPSERDWYATRVRPLAFRPDRVTPMPLFRAGGALPPSLQAHLRSVTVSRTADVPFTDGMRAAFRPLGHLLALLDLPLSLPWTIRFLDDAPGFRSAVLARVPDRDLKSFFEALPTTVPRNTRLGLIRRIADLTSHPLLKCVIGTPPADVARLLPNPEEAMVELGFFAPGIAMPYGPARERAASWLLDELLLGQIRTDETPKVIAVEELGVLASIAPEIIPTLADSNRILRAKRVAIWSILQDPSSLPRELLVPTLLNARWMICFQTLGEDARVLLPHLEGIDGKGRTDLERELAALPERAFFCWIKGEGAPVRLTSVPFLDPWVEAGTTKEELLEEFFRATSRWMLPVATCEELIGRFEAEFVTSGVGTAAPADATPAAVSGLVPAAVPGAARTAGKAPRGPKPAARGGGLAALLTALDGDRDRDDEDDEP